MQLKLKIKKGDTVKIIAGDSKGQQGKILSIDRKKLKAIVEGVNIISKHSKPTAATPNGGIVKKEAPVHISNVMFVDASGKPSRIGRKKDTDNKLVRYSKKSGEVIK